MSVITICEERAADISAISQVIAEAFQEVEHSDQTEPFIVSALRRARALSVSLVAVKDGVVVGHVAFSPVCFANDEGRWFGLGPVSVLPECQGEGIGAALIREGLDRLRGEGVKGCVLLGEPAYYSRFGFQSTGDCYFEGAPPEYFQVLPFGNQWPVGAAIYHQAFAATE